VSEQHYIGDGVYVSFDGYQIKCETMRESGRQELYFEPDTFQSLLDFAKQIGWLK